MSITEIPNTAELPLGKEGQADGVRQVVGELTRYLAVAVIALMVDFGTLVALRDGASWHYLPSAGAAFCLGLLTNYILSICCVFSQRAVQNRLVEFGVFAFVGVLGLMFTEIILYCGTDLWRLDYRLSKVAAVGCVFMWNFGARKFLLFRA